MKILLTVTLPKNKSNDINLILFGKGNKVPSELLKGIKDFENEGVYYVNESINITDEITLSVKKTKKKIQESEIPFDALVDLEYYLEITDKATKLAKEGKSIAEWLWNKIGHKLPELTLFDKKIKTKNALQKTLDEYFENEK